MAEEVKATQQQPSAPVAADDPAEVPDSVSSKPADDKPAEPTLTGTSNGDKNVEEAPPVASGALQVDAMPETDIGDAPDDAVKGDVEQDAIKGDATAGKGAEAAEEASGAAKETKTESQGNVKDHVYDGNPEAGKVAKSDEQASAVEKDVSMSEPASEVPAPEPATAPKPEDTTGGAPEVNGVIEPPAAPTEMPAAEANGAGEAQVEPAAVSSKAAKGGKRKAEEVEEPAATNGNRAEKKAKTAKTDAVKNKANGVDASRARPKKEKSTTADAAPVGKTLRKTRSQGPA